MSRSTIAKQVLWSTSMTKHAATVEQHLSDTAASATHVFPASESPTNELTIPR